MIGPLSANQLFSHPLIFNIPCSLGYNMRKLAFRSPQGIYFTVHYQILGNQDGQPTVQCLIRLHICSHMFICGRATFSYSAVQPPPWSFGYNMRKLAFRSPWGNYFTVHYQILGNRDKNLRLASQQYRAWSDCTYVQAGLALHWCQRLIIFVPAG